MRINRKTLFFIIFLILAVIILLVLKILNKQLPSEETAPEITPSITIFPTQNLTQTPTLSPEDKVIKQLPIVNNNYTIEYSAVSRKFIVIILKNPYKKFKAEAEGWFTSQEIDPKSPDIFWGSIKGVY